MDKNTLGHYGWIVVVVIIIAILLGCSANFAGAIKDNFIGVVNKLSNEAAEGMGVIDGEQGGGSGGGGGGGSTLALTISNLPNSDSADPLKVDTTTFTLTGSAYSDAGIKSLTVNGTPVTVAADGAWSAPLTLADDSVTEVIIIATDNDNNTTTETRYIIYDNPVNEYGFYFNRLYALPDRSFGYVFYEDGYVGLFNSLDTELTCDMVVEATFTDGSAVDSDGYTYTFSEDGLAVNDGYDDYTLTDDEVRGVYVGETYICVEEGYEDQTIVFNEDGSGTMGDFTAPISWTVDHYGEDGYFQVSLDGTVVYIDGMRFELATGPILTITNPKSVDEFDPSYTPDEIFTVSGTAFSPDGIKTLTVNGVEVSVGADGAWSTNITLVMDETTTITVMLTDNSDVAVEEIRYVCYIDTPPTLTIISPEGTSSAAPTRVDNNSCTVFGTVFDNIEVASLTVNGVDVNVNADGSWSTTITLTQGQTTRVTVVAADNTGETTTIERYVLYPNPPAYALVLDNSADAENSVPMIFVRSANVITAGDTYNSDTYGELTVLAAYTDFETTSYDFSNKTPWRADYATTLTSAVIEDEISPQDMNYWFYGCTALKTAPAIPSSVTEMGCTFSGCTSLATAPDMSNATQVTDMGSAFSGCTALTTAPVIPASVTWMRGTFANCTSLTAPPDMSNAVSVTDMQMTFYGCTALTSAPDISNAMNLTNLKDCFSGCSSLTTAPVIPENVTSMHQTFSGCKVLKTYAGSTDSDGDFSGYVIPSRVTNITAAFDNCAAIVIAPDLSNATSVTEMSATFRRCTALTTAPVIPAKVKLLSQTFQDCTSLVIAPVIPESVTDMNYIFYGCTSLTTAPAIPANVTIMSSTFSGCTSLKTYHGSTDVDGDFSGYVIPSRVANMQATFASCTSLVIAPAIPSSVTNMSTTFSNCTELTAAPAIPASVTNMQETFYNCTSLTGTITINTNNITTYTWGASNSCSRCFGGVDMTNITLAGEASKTVLNLIGSTGKNWTLIP